MSKSFPMILPKHYLKSAFINFKRNKWYTFLMMISLAAGMFCFVLASIYIDYEFSRNTNHEDSERVYRVMLRYGNKGRNTYLPANFAERLPEFNPGIEALSLLDAGREDQYLSIDGESYIKEEDVFYADAGFFEVFSFPLKYGSEVSALEETSGVVISNKLSELLFPGLNPVGKELMFHKKGTFKVTGVLEPVSQLSLMNPGLIFTRGQYYKQQPKRPVYSVLFTHVKMKEPIDQAKLEADLYSDFKRHFGDDRINGVFTEKLTDAYWGGSHYDYGAQFSSLMGMDKGMIKMVGYVSVGVLVCAFIGYLSLALSLSLKRVKEIGVRKVNGAGSKDIRVQLLSESVVYSLLSLLITIVALELSEDYFSGLFKVPIALDLTSAAFTLPLVGFAILTGTIAGIYPALVVSKLRPVSILSGLSNPLSGRFKLKQILLIVQLSVTVILVFSVYILRLQVREMSVFDFGYRKENVISFSLGNESIEKNYQAVLEDLQSLNGLEELTGGPFPYTINGYYQARVLINDSLIEQSIGRVRVANNFFDVMEVPIVEGNDFQAVGDTPLSRACVVNQTFADMLGGNVLGMSIEYANEPRIIVGIAQNYTDWGISSPEADARIYTPESEAKFHSLLLRFNGLDDQKHIAQMETIWRKYETVKEPEIVLLSKEKEEATVRLSKMSTLFGFLATTVLVLSFLNLFGVSIMYAEGKLKSVSIRRVLGAETSELFRRLSMPFLMALCLSLVIAIPIGYSIMASYLQGFAVRIQLGSAEGIWVSVALVVLLFTVIGYQMLRFSKANPAEVLKGE
ncbi:MAG: ABC transporter permease [Roseivirga sp.]